MDERTHRRTHDTVVPEGHAEGGYMMPRRDVQAAAPRAVVAPVAVDKDAVERIRQEELAEEWRRAGQYD